MGDVIFINTLYFPSLQERERLDKMQEIIHFSRLEYLHAIRYDHPGMRYARIENLTKMYRAKWEVYPKPEPDEEITHL